MSERLSLTKSIKNEEQELKDAVQERILVLTDEEVDKLIFEKWFASTVSQITGLVKIPLKSELDTLKMLQERYADTLADIDSEIESLMSEFETLRNELVVE